MTAMTISPRAEATGLRRKDDGDGVKGSRHQQRKNISLGPLPPPGGNGTPARGRWGVAQASRSRWRKNIALGPLPTPRRQETGLRREDDGGLLKQGGLEDLDINRKKLIALSPIPPSRASLCSSAPRLMIAASQVSWPGSRMASWNCGAGDHQDMPAPHGRRSLRLCRSRTRIEGLAASEQGTVAEGGAGSGRRSKGERHATACHRKGVDRALTLAARGIPERIHILLNLPRLRLRPHYCLNCQHNAQPRYWRSPSLRPRAPVPRLRARPPRKGCDGAG